MLYLFDYILLIEHSPPLPGEPETFLLSVKEWGGSPSDMNTGDQAEQEAVVSKCHVVSFGHWSFGAANKNLWNWDLVAFNLQIFVPSGGQSLHQSSDWTPSFLFFLSDSLLINLFLCWMLGSSALYYVFTLLLFCFACLLLLLHICLPLSLCMVCLAFCYQLVLPAPGLFHVRASVAVMFRLGPAWLALHTFYKICVRALSGMSNAQYECNHSSG